jgi:hypothetical protein
MFGAERNRARPDRGRAIWPPRLRRRGRLAARHGHQPGRAAHRRARLLAHIPAKPGYDRDE